MCYGERKQIAQLYAEYECDWWSIGSSSSVSESSSAEKSIAGRTEQGVVTPIGPVLTTATAVKLFDRPKRALTV